jgi:FkbH-like protein
MKSMEQMLNNSLEEFWAAGENQRSAASKNLICQLKALAESDPAACGVALQRVISPNLDYTTALALHRIKRKVANNVKFSTKVRVAVLGSFTTDQLTQLLDLYLFAAGLDAEIYEADYGLVRQEILDPTSTLYEFKPSFIILATNWRDLSRCPNLTDNDETARACVDSECSEWLQLWKVAFDRTGAQILQNNFDTPPWRQLGNHELRHPASFTRFVNRVNDRLADVAPPYVTLHDVDALASSAGKWTWGDERFYLQAKMPCAPAFLVDYAHSISSIFAAQTGVNRKCLVLDLDNTLWGGVIGDDGLGGIRLGQGHPESEAFTSFQKYVKSLRMRGVILAVCSKNEDANAREVFEKHPEMQLRLEDISCFVANWNDKASNIRSIAKRLEIGLNSMVFVDDNPAERAIVRQLLPEVAVPELPSDPSGYIQAVERHRYFQVASLSAEDFSRTDFYTANEARLEAESSSQSIGDFLASLNMVARVEPLQPTNLERSVQLINRSNQFNLTTKRYSSGEVMALLGDRSWVTLTISLSDRFGDNGLISVLLARVEGTTLAIDTWLMSCRVLKRDVEVFALEQLLVLARERGLSRVTGEYVPTPKNGLVRDHFEKLGFTCTGSDELGHTRWEYGVSSEPTLPKTHIRLAAENPLPLRK